MPVCPTEFPVLLALDLDMLSPVAVRGLAWQLWSLRLGRARGQRAWYPGVWLWHSAVTSAKDCLFPSWCTSETSALF